jgi:hypothetical protein
MEIKTRLWNLTTFPLTLGKTIGRGACKLSAGIGATFASCATFGYFLKCNKVADWTAVSARIAPEIIEGTVQIIHPDFALGEADLDSCFATPLKQIFMEHISKAADSENVLFKHFTSRVLSFIMIPVLLVARVADLALGILMIPRAFFNGFSDPERNREMAGALNFLATIDDIAIGVRGIFNPSQFSIDENDIT